MNQRAAVFVGWFAGAIFLAWATGVFFTVHQTQQALVLHFGEARHVHTEPGLKWKIPFIQDVIFLEKRMLDIDLPAVHITMGDQKRLVVDVYARYRISDPLLFFKSIKPVHESGVKVRLEAMISSNMRNTLGKVPLRHMLTAERAPIMHQIDTEVRSLAHSLGMEMIDVRIMRTELPPENRQAVFSRMNAELGRFAMENRAKGAEAAQKIRAEADKECVVILATAQKEADGLRGEGDQKALETANEAYSKDVDLYTYYQNLRNCETALENIGQALFSMDSPWLAGLLSPFHSIRRHP